MRNLNSESSRHGRRPGRSLRHVALLLTLLPTPYLAAAEAAVPGLVPPAVDFYFEVQPILNDSCVRCHGPDEVKGGLRLDSPAALLEGGASGPAVAAGDSLNSRLFRAVAGLDPTLRMPTKGDPLSPAHLATLRWWIDQGAMVPETGSPQDAPRSNHWAFRQVVRPEVPAIQDTAWVRNSIDSFVLAPLEREGIAPSPEADPVTLLRRLYLDLLGLPPSPEEVAAFVQDSSAEAYSTLVTGLLENPHFGERWGRHWLDLARYADSDGYEKDTVRPYAYRYRDWVIDALNRDLPYNEFVIEQMAGDLLPNASQEQVMATGFHRNTLTNREGGVDPEEDRVKQAVDRTNTVGAVFMGLSMGCAQCHSHKYDPISQREYYEMYSFFNESLEKDIPAPGDGEREAYEVAKTKFEADSAGIRAEIEAYEQTLAAKLPEWEATLNVDELKGWQTLDPVSYASLGGSEFRELEDQSLLLTGQSPGADMYTVVIRTRETGIKGIRLEALTHDELTKKGPGRAHNGNFVLGEFSLTAAPLTDPRQAERVKFKEAFADFEQSGYPAANTIDGNPETGWAIFREDGTNQNVSATYVPETEIGFRDGTILTFTLDHRYGREHNIGRFRLSLVTVDPRGAVFSNDVYEALTTAADARNESQRKVVLDYFSSADEQMWALRSKLDEIEKGAPKAPDTMAQALVMNPDPPRSYIQLRGDFLSPGDEVHPGTPALFPPLEARGGHPDRLDLARWIAQPRNPLAARVAVNRIWEKLFGQGIVYTSEDFGTRTDPPTHPELLDWLADEFVTRGWSTKALIRLIVESSAYRQSSKFRLDLWERDPGNYLVARQGRFRVEAEVTRDLFLAASGLLNAEIGGPSVRPPLPSGVADLGYAGSVKWAQSAGDDIYRRGLYIFFQRTVAYPMLMAFDCPDSNVTTLKRSRSNSPLQALTLLNDPVFVECAQALGKRIIEEGPEDPRARLRYAFRLCLAREADDFELDELARLLEEHRAVYAGAADAALELSGPYKPESAEAPQAAAHVVLARTLMNLDEFVTRE